MPDGEIASQATDETRAGRAAHRVSMRVDGPLCACGTWGCAELRISPWPDRPPARREEPGYEGPES
jgi:hypothetical protein